MTDLSLSSRAMFWRGGNSAVQKSEPALFIFPPCSDSDDGLDDNSGVARILFFVAFYSAGGQTVNDGEAEFFRKIARVHVHEGNIYLLVRAPISPDTVDTFARAYARLTGNKKGRLNVSAHREDDATWKRVWNAKKFKAATDPFFG